MDASTRPPQKRHRAKLHLAVGLVALYFGVGTSVSAVSEQLAPQPATDILPLPSALHDFGIATVKSGEEGLQLSARFTNDGEELVRDVSWKISSASGEEVFSGITTNVDAVLAPNNYQVEASYGTSHFVQVISVQPGTKVIVNFVLNAGAMRIMPRIKGIASAVTSHSIIYAASGPQKDKLITTSHTPGEVIKLSAGDYRVENIVDSGNAVVITYVHINAGRMSAVEITHQVGLARLITDEPQDSDTLWLLTDASGKQLPPVLGRDAALKPGHYTANLGILKTDFTIDAGQTLDINLSN
jgi:hypothetical protein